MSLRILGIDPGLTRCGIGIIDVEKTRASHFVAVEVFRSSTQILLEHRILEIVTRIEECVDQYNVDRIGLEKVFAQKNLHTVMPVANLCGAILYVAAKRAIPISLYTPTEVKAAVTGYGSADKLQVQTMIMRILKLDTIPKPADAADALAVALAHAWRGQ